MLAEIFDNGDSNKMFVVDPWGGDNLLGVIGDEHGNITQFVFDVVDCVENGAQAIIQVGDFNMQNYDGSTWPGAYTFDALNRALDTIAYKSYVDIPPIYFIDGNHENFDFLDPNATEPVKYGNVTYVPRGVSLDILGRKIGFLGGASSIDKDLRTPGFDWFPEESIDRAQGDRLIGKDLDILVTHDSSTKVFKEIMKGKNVYGVGVSDRMIIDTVLDSTEPMVHVHGHLHTSKMYQCSDTERYTMSLNCNGRRGAVQYIRC